MRLNHLSIGGFRSINQIEIQVDQFCALVGENSSGKSTILQAINILLESKSKFTTLDLHTTPGRTAENIKLECTFNELSAGESQALIELFAVPLTEIKISKEINSELKQSTFVYLPVPTNLLLDTNNVKGSTKKQYQDAVEDGKLPEYILGPNKKANLGDIKEGIHQYLKENVASVEWGNASAFELKGKTLTDFYKILPEPLYVPAFDDISDHVKPKARNLLGKLLNQVFAQIGERPDGGLKRIDTQLRNLTNKFRRPEAGDDRREKELLDLETQLTGYLSNILSEAQVRLDFNLPSVESLLPKYFELKLYDGVLTPVANKGHGAQRTLIWALLRTYLDNLSGKGDSNVIFLVEEPELYLHPQAQRVMLGVLRELSNTEQVIYSTHSAVYVNLQQPEFIRLIRKRNKETKVDFISQNTLESRKTEIRFLTWVDDERSELFFAKSVVLVEGDTERILFQQMNDERIEGKTLDELGCQIIVTGGKFTMPFYCSLLNDVGIPYFVIYDRDSRNSKHQEVNNHIETAVRTGTSNKLNVKSHIFDPFLEKDWGFETPVETLKVSDMLERIVSWREGEDKPKKYENLCKEVYDFAKSARLI